MMSKPNTLLFNGSFFVAYWQAVLRTFTRFSVNVLARVDFWYNNLGLWLGKPNPGQKSTEFVQKLISLFTYHFESDGQV